MSQSVVARRRVFHKRRDAKRQYVQQVKSSTPCADCGVQFPYWIMDFDHVRGEKRYAIGTLAASNLSMDYLIEEISNCDVVCANCHRNRTYARKSWQQERLATDPVSTGVPALNTQHKTATIASPVTH